MPGTVTALFALKQPSGAMLKLDRWRFAPGLACRPGAAIAPGAQRP
jgi:hypothetical protein